MSTYYISAVHMERAPDATHDHIGRVKILGAEGDYTRAQIIVWIYEGHEFYTNAVPPALVYVHSCPHCGAWDYITTHPDDTTTNNLLSLPRY
jgi:uncharacterized protein DUF3892